jgi:hypothetical protein
MFIRPEMGRLLAQAKLEEAKSRMPSVAAVRAASLERQSGPARGRGLIRRYRREAPMPTTTRGSFLRRPSVRPNAPKTTNG